MGNRMCRRRREVVEEKYTRPHRLVRQPSNVDYKKLRKLILSKKLAPCFDGVDDSSPDLEECPICFFFFPSLNRSKCCAKGICTECFLQMKPTNPTHLAQCPFCKFSSYAVEYYGAKTQEEKNLEQAEEQKVIEAKIRMQMQTLGSHDLEEEELSSSDELDNTPPSCSEEPRCVHFTGDAIQSRGQTLSPHPEMMDELELPERWRDSNFSVDLDEIMLTEAIWQSIQDNCSQKATEQSTLCRQSLEGPRYESAHVEPSSLSSGHRSHSLANGELARNSGSNCFNSSRSGRGDPACSV